MKRHSIEPMRDMRPVLFSLEADSRRSKRGPNYRRKTKHTIVHEDPERPETTYKIALEERARGRILDLRALCLGDPFRLDGPFSLDVLDLLRAEGKFITVGAISKILDVTNPFEKEKDRKRYPGAMTLVRAALDRLEAAGLVELTFRVNVRRATKVWFARLRPRESVSA